MANPEHLAILKQGVEIWNRWRAKNLEVTPDLRGANLSGLFLEGAQLVYADLRDATLSEASLSSAHLNVAGLVGATLIHTSLSGAYLNGADCRGANLYRATLNFADLSRTNFTNANFNSAAFSGTVLCKVELSGASFYNAGFAGAILADVDLSNVRGLESVSHGHSSTIGIDTLYRSGGNIPEVFLRGAGVPDGMITYMKSLVGKPIEYFSCFISHSTKDKIFCEQLYADLQTNGVRTWYFPEDAKWGESVWGEIDRSIKIYDKLVVVCSENSLQSGPVLREIERALNREDQEKKSILFPIRIDNYIFDHWEYERKTDVARKIIGDFTQWYDNASEYDKALKRLLKALKTE